VKSLSIASLALALVLSGCGGQGSSTNENSSTRSVSKRETCREITRLIGKATDITNKYNNGESVSLADLTGVAFSMGQAAKETTDSELKSAALALQEGLNLMADEDTFFEGMQIYLGEILPVTTKCQVG
jgi:ABC-type Fe3+-hydroxamate transport system substrate-binding protein